MRTLTNESFLQNNKYRILDTLGVGGFGITYLVEQVSLGRKVAIKEFFMKEYCVRDCSTLRVSVLTESSRKLVEIYKQKFIKEAQMIASLNNTHIVRVYDVFEENDTAYYVMELLDNGSLMDSVENNGPMSENEALNYIFQVADALSYIHKKSILHLDIKPSNILLNEDGEAVLIDFGISKHYDSEGGQTSTTPVGISKGFASMEQYQQGSVSRFSPATDIYSLGATLFYLLTAKTPPEAVVVYEEGLPEIGNHVSSKTAAAIKMAMSPKRKDRPQTIEDFILLLGVSQKRVINNKVKTSEKHKPYNPPLKNKEDEITIEQPSPSQQVPSEQSDTKTSIAGKKRSNKRTSAIIWPIACITVAIVLAIIIDNKGDTGYSTQNVKTITEQSS